MKQLLQNMRDGKAVVEDVPAPIPKPGMVLVKTGASLVSAGTERMVVEFAGKSLLGKARARPDLVRQVVDKARREGALSTLEAAFNRLDQPMALGYSSAGTIVEVGAGAQGFKAGQRVACAGGGYAVHAEYAAVPVNLAAPLPEGVSFEAGAFGTLGAIALHGFRLARPQIGETVVVIGLGLLGLLSAGIARAAGCRVLGVDLDPARVALAEKFGIGAVRRSQAEEATSAFTKGLGADVVLICADTSSNDPVELAGEAARERGRVVAVGAVGLEIPRRVYYYKELDFIVSRSYGPGRYDRDYEEGGQDYPAGFVRWTAGRNLAAFVELLGEGKLDVSALITHRFPIEEAAGAYELISGGGGETYLGVVLTYGEGSPSERSKEKTVFLDRGPGGGKTDQVKMGVIGAGNFAGAVLLPAMKKVPGVDLVGIASAGGLSAKHAARKFGFSYAASDANALIEDAKIDTVAILTRHGLHAELVLAALRAGKHVFCEKPLALRREDLDETEAELKKPEAPILMVGFNRRFAPMALEMKAFLDARQEPMMAHYRVNAGYLPPDHWLHDPEEGGGRIIGEGCHFIDFLAFLAGAPPAAVSAQGLPDGGRYMEDNVALTFEFPDGSVGTLSYLANGDRAAGKERVEVFAGGRVAILDDFRRLEMAYRGKKRVVRSRWRQDKGHLAELKAFSLAIRQKGVPPIAYDDIIGISRTAIDAAEALRSGRRQGIG